MVKVLECECGYVARGEDDGELVAAAQAHARTSHGMELPARLILSRASTARVRTEGGAPRAQGGMDRS
jgi:Protein of unknown function (DUF1059)